MRRASNFSTAVLHEERQSALSITIQKVRCCSGSVWTWDSPCIICIDHQDAGTMMKSSKNKLVTVIMSIRYLTIVYR